MASTWEPIRSTAKPCPLDDDAVPTEPDRTTAAFSHSRSNNSKLIGVMEDQIWDLCQSRMGAAEENRCGECCSRDVSYKLLTDFNRSELAWTNTITHVCSGKCGSGRDNSERTWPVSSDKSRPTVWNSAESQRQRSGIRNYSLTALRMQ